MNLRDSFFVVAAVFKNPTLQQQLKKVSVRLGDNQNAHVPQEQTNSKTLEYCVAMSKEVAYVHPLRSLNSIPTYTLHTHVFSKMDSNIHSNTIPNT